MTLKKKKKKGLELSYKLLSFLTITNTHNKKKRYNNCILFGTFIVSCCQNDNKHHTKVKDKKKKKLKQETRR